VVLEVDDRADPSTGPRRRRGLAAFLLSGDGWPYALLPFIPIAIALEFAHASSALIFSTSAIGVIPTAALMGRATEELADRAGPGIGGLLNVTFGNLPELLIALFALREGLHEVVKASIIGSSSARPCWLEAYAASGSCST
jgi:Ca2+:H+ antiporter